MASILIVDDSPTHCLALKLIVEKLGHVAVVAQTGEEGVQKAIDIVPDLILMDVVMPGLNGYQATRMLTADPVTAHVPIVLVTSKDQAADEVWGRRQGAQDYITKPVAEDALVAVIHRLVTQVSQLHRSLAARLHPESEPEKH